MPTQNRIAIIRVATRDVEFIFGKINVAANKYSSKVRLLVRKTSVNSALCT